MRSGYDTAYYYRDGTGDGIIVYNSEISEWPFDHVFKWNVYYYSEGGESPINPTKIWAKGRSLPDYCTDYDSGGFWPVPLHTWHEPNLQNECNDGGSYYFYWVKGDVHYDGVHDYTSGDPMVRWDYWAGDEYISTQVWYAGVYPG